ncbi:hypothetical protein [Staphylococcus pseudoxylosus]|uniref:Competence protein ComGE n=1 Tax=Staphylococcus pseudoxylosus TaxID=2282419 RepID=A0AAQ0S7V5_9STAP|nr:hypothetical protein [Staphylococcus pseudoxylosus]PTI79453.1 hypothetical protein BU098_14220 [Staphylococcus xylosus]MBM2658524.1 hypothetical protein [Staphylococcus pseudoxylosus]MEB5783793.1 hypothetical protein [Staphylococcus pseudoxylosus]RMI86248.1 hypothetical protein D9V42_00195 [Staphylococcus pseudoxylosus]RQM86561.1 hypothetical protein CO206_02950 [Staphylococcus xylosus]
MKKYNLQGSLFIDALLSFSTITLICILFIPFMLQLSKEVQNKIIDMEMKRVIISSLYRYDKSVLKKGIDLNTYHLKLSNQKLCITRKGTKYEKCYGKKT